MLIGVIIAVASANMNSESLTLDEVIDTFTATRAIIYTIFLLSVLLLLGLYMVYAIFYVKFNNLSTIQYNILLFAFPIFAGFMGGYTYL